ncbi:flagellar export chaperone FliS [Gryllotalpicola sp.]|uniref:flagellar export chaperone FliS n=1 Tax=Gryllotalpicola sp. TaxID=1932787 RepID=UPI0026215D57|nr:flagellar export chaperone FliS [Gryllotalpicola sp.]
MTNALQARTAYTRESVLSATPAQLVVMLYDRLVLDMQRAEAAQLAEEWIDAHGHLMHAQDIITELQLTLRMDVWDGADRLFAIYVYVKNALAAANLNRDVERTREALRLMTPLRESWTQAALSLQTSGSERGVA